MEICTPPSKDMGLMYCDVHDNQPRFVLLPRIDALKINKNGTKLCSAMTNISKKAHLVRGASKSVFGQEKYCCVGSKPRQSAIGIEPGHYNLDGIQKDDWDAVVNAVKWCKQAFYCYAGTKAIRHIREARDAVPWERIQNIERNIGSGPAIFNGIAFDVNVFLHAHIDHDFTYSLIQVHVNGIEYGINDEQVCYFCFPRLGLAIPLKPGDFLLVNALEYHCLSSRCKSDVDIFCLSSYLKTAVVGGHNNKRPLSKNEQECLKAFDKAVVAKKRSRNLPFKYNQQIK